MAIARLIYVSLDPSQSADAERIWKQDCAPLMIQQDGCTSEELLKSVDVPGEFISYSEWQDQGAIDRYLQSAAHKQVLDHTRSLKRKSDTVVKRYEVAG